MMLFYKNFGGKFLEGFGCCFFLCGFGIWLMFGRGLYGLKWGCGSLVFGVILILLGMNGKLGNRLLWLFEIKKWWIGYVIILIEEFISYIIIL